MPRCILCNHNDEMPNELSLTTEVVDYNNPVSVSVNSDDMLCLRCRESSAEALEELMSKEEEDVC